jgi:hypothetical protein
MYEKVNAGAVRKSAVMVLAFSQVWKKCPRTAGSTFFFLFFRVVCLKTTRTGRLFYYTWASAFARYVNESLKLRGCPGEVLSNYHPDSACIPKRN